MPTRELGDLLQEGAVKTRHRIHRHRIEKGDVPYRTIDDIPHAVMPDGSPYTPGYLGESVDGTVESYTINSADNLAADQVNMNGTSDTFGAQTGLWDYMDLVTIDEHWSGAGGSAGWIRKATALLDEAKTTAGDKERANNQTLRGGAKLLTLTPFVGKLHADKIKMVGANGKRIKLTCLTPNPTEDKPYYRFVHARPGASNPEEERYFLWCDRPRPRIWVKDGNRSLSVREGSIQVVYGDGEILIEKEFFETPEREAGLGNPRDAQGRPWLEIEYRRWALEEDEVYTVTTADATPEAPNRIPLNPPEGSQPDTWVGSHVFVQAVPEGAAPCSLYRRWKVRRVAREGDAVVGIEVDADKYGLTPGTAGLAAGSELCVFDCNRVERKLLEVFCDAGFQGYLPFEQDTMRGLFYIAGIEAPKATLKLGGYPIRPYAEEVWKERTNSWGQPLPPVLVSPEKFGVERAGGVATFHLAITHGLAAGDMVLVAGVDNPAFNGTWTVASVPDRSTFTVASAGPDAHGSGGVVNPVGKLLTQPIFLPSSDDFEFTKETGKNHAQVLDEIRKYLPSNYMWWVDEYTRLRARSIEQLEKGYTLDSVEKVEAATSDTELKTAVRYRVRDVTLRNVATRTAGCSISFNREMVVSKDEGEPGPINLPMCMWGRTNNEAQGSKSAVQKYIEESFSWDTWEDMPQEMIDRMLAWEKKLEQNLLDGKYDTRVRWEVHDPTPHHFDGMWLFQLNLAEEVELKTLNFRGEVYGTTAGKEPARISIEHSTDDDFWDELIPDFEFSTRNKCVAQFTEKDFGSGIQAKHVRVRAEEFTVREKYDRHMVGFCSVTLWPSDVVFGEAILGETEDFDSDEDKALAAKLNMGQPRWHTVPQIDEQGYHIARLMFGEIANDRDRLITYAKARAKETLFEMTKDFTPVSITGVRPDLKKGDTVNMAARKAGFGDTSFLVREVNHTSDGTVTAKLYPYREMRWTYNPGTPVVETDEPYMAFSNAPANQVVEGAGPFPLAPAAIVTVFAPDGKPLQSFTGAVTLSLLGGDGAALSGTTEAAASSGVVAFTDLAIDAPSPGYALVARATVVYNEQTFALSAQSHYFSLSEPGRESLAFLSVPASVVQQSPAQSPDRTPLSTLSVRLSPRDERTVAEYAGSATVSLVGTGGGSGGQLFGTLTQPVSQGTATFSDLAIDAPGRYSLRVSFSVTLDGQPVADLVIDAPEFAVIARSGTIEGEAGGPSVRWSLSIPVLVHVASEIPGPPEDGVWIEDLSSQMDGVKTAFTPAGRIRPRSKIGCVVSYNGVRLAPASFDVADGAITIHWDQVNPDGPGKSGDSLVAEYPYNYVPA